MKKTIILAVLPCALGVEVAHGAALLKPTSGVTQALSPKSLHIESNLRGAFAQTTVTTTYANPNSQRIEADFMYSAPKGSVVTGFAYWYGKEKVVARVVEKKRAAQIYQYITTRMQDPALIEMVGPNTFRARIFPVEANTDLKIEVRLAQTLGATKDGQQWSWPLKEETRGGTLENVSVHLKSDRAFRSNLGTVQNNELRFERTNFLATGTATVLVPQNAAPLRASLVAARDGGADGFFALALASNSPVALPRLKISGVSTFDVLVPTVRRLDANGNFVVVGRYRGSGTALVSLNGRSVQVKFPDVRETRNLPSLLWAMRRMESLSSKESNKAQVTKLSKRYGMPSRWTSWLAIPTEERQNFRREILTSDRDLIGKAYAQAVARGDRAEMRAQKAAFTKHSQQMKAEGFEDEVVEPESFLDDELSAVRQAIAQAKYRGKVSPKQRAQWTVWAKNLERAGASENDESIVEGEFRTTAQIYLREIEAGRENGRTAHRFKARLKKLAQNRTARENEWTENSFVEELAEERAAELATEIATIRVSERPNSARQKRLERHLARLVNVADTESALQSALEEVVTPKLSSLTQRWADEIAAGRGAGAQAAQLKRQVRALEARPGLKDIAAVNSIWSSLAEDTGARLADEIRLQGPNGAAARKLDAQIQGIATQSQRSQEELHTAAWERVLVVGINQLGAKIGGDAVETPEAKSLQQQLEILTKAQKDTGDSPADEAWRSVATQASDRLAREVEARRENSFKALALQSQIDVAAKFGGDSYNQDQLRSAWDRRSQEVAKQVIEQVATGGATPQTKELEALAKEFSLKGNAVNVPIGEEALKKLDELGDAAGTEIGAKREDSPQINTLRRQYQNVRSAFSQAQSVPSDKTIDAYEQFAWEGRAHEAAYQLLEAQKSTPAETARIEELERELDRSAKEGGKNRDEVVLWEQNRLAQNEPLVTADQYRLRAGDPLISVLAPATCRQVVAQMPDGTLLPLRFNAFNKAWEARFDVPTFALDGDYRVRILIVGSSGERRQLAMNFAVDSRAPQGSGAVKVEGKTWHLGLESDEHTDRVSAFLPWNERVELRRDEHAVFSADVAVPEKMGDLKAQVRFLLTDGAHNKTEVLVDLNN